MLRLLGDDFLDSLDLGSELTDGVTLCGAVASPVALELRVFLGIVELGVYVDSLDELVVDVVGVIEAILCLQALGVELQQQLFFFAGCHGVFGI